MAQMARAGSRSNRASRPGKTTHLVFRSVVIAALIVAFAQVSLGGIVRVTGSGLGCPDWPLCHGQIVPPLQLAAIIEYSHRLSASLLGVLTIAVVGLAWAFYRTNLWVPITGTVGLALVLTAAVLGGVTVLTELAWWTVLIHLAVAELVVACIVIVVVAGWGVNGLPQASAPEPSEEADRFHLLALATGIGVLTVMLSGSYMVGQGAGSSCATWPLCNGTLIPAGTPYVVHMGHRLATAVVAVLVSALVVSTWTQRAERPDLGWASMALAAAFGIQIVAGAVTVWTGFSPQMKVLHLSMGTVVWAALVFVVALRYSNRRLELGPFRVGPLRLSKAQGLTR